MELPEGRPRIGEDWRGPPGTGRSWAGKGAGTERGRAAERLEVGREQASGELRGASAVSLSLSQVLIFLIFLQAPAAGDCWSVRNK